MGSSASASSREDFSDTRLGHVEDADLTEPHRLAAIERRIIAAGLVTGNTDRMRLMVWSAAQRAIRYGRDPASFFASLILGPPRNVISQVDEELAQQAIKAHYQGIKPRQPVPEEEQTA